MNTAFLLERISRLIKTLKSNKFLPFDANLKVLKSVDTGISFEYAKKKLTRQVTRYDNDDAVY
ncbi:hypothetical protein DERP_009704 [Dermatophagoides pteronyssinus]|uniref:Uncharacterized protein n=1 Tax=Dermatophagoides pteronyssinus TaxID=6956 RepID=A0ABQ8JAM6_DERPT|nr:hypothetical protein DERP_009704 [Dermatophagoides pteronyssinus]